MNLISTRSRRTAFASPTTRITLSKMLAVQTSGRVVYDGRYRHVRARSVMPFTLTALMMSSSSSSPVVGNSKTMKSVRWSHMHVKPPLYGSATVTQPADDQFPRAPAPSMLSPLPLSLASSGASHHLHSIARMHPRLLATDAFSGAPMQGGGACSTLPFLKTVLAGTNGIEMLIALFAPATLSRLPCCMSENETIGLLRAFRLRWLTLLPAVARVASEPSSKSRFSAPCILTSEVNSTTSTGNVGFRPCTPLKMSGGRMTAACEVPPSVSAVTGRVTSSSIARASVVRLRLAVCRRTSPSEAEVTARASCVTAERIWTEDSGWTVLSSDTSCSMSADMKEHDVCAVDTSMDVCVDRMSESCDAA